MKTSSSPTARTAILTTILASDMDPTMPAGLSMSTTTTERSVSPDPGDGWDDYSYDDEGWGDYFDE